MSARLPSTWTNTLTNALPGSAVETIIATLPPLNITWDVVPILLFWFLSVQAGTGTTALVFKLRRGAVIGGTSISLYTWQQTVVAASYYLINGTYFDIPGIVAGQQYVLTCSQTGATGGGSIQDLAMLAISL